MRCYCCDVLLTPKQATRRFKESQVFTDMCDSCLSTISVETVDGKGVDDEVAEEYTDDLTIFDEDTFEE